MEKLFKELFEFLKECARLEMMATAGRINLLGMVLSLILAVTLSLGPILEAVVHLIRPQVNVGVSVIQVFVIFCVFTIICAGMLGYLERGSAPRGNNENASRRPSAHARHTDPDDHTDH
jgi:hypothetical protein